MKIEIKTEKENPFLERKEFMITILHDREPTPSKAAVQKFLSKELKQEATHVEVRQIMSRNGLGHSNAKVFVWKEPKAKDLEKEAAKPMEEKKE
jgi:ribosomal protein S24E